MNALGTRMKQYEAASQVHLTQRMPLIIRVDGRSFHTFTRGMEKPWDEGMGWAMRAAALGLCEETDGCVVGYQQSDEISLLVIDYQKFSTMPWFDKNLQKIVSVTASIATATFNRNIETTEAARLEYAPACFDSRAFVIPREEVCNYFVDRQRDAIRNSINSLGQAYFSPKELHGLNTDQVQDKLLKDKGVNWHNLTDKQQRGLFIYRDYDDGNWTVHSETPIFSISRDVIKMYVWDSTYEGEADEKTS